MRGGNTMAQNQRSAFLSFNSQWQPNSEKQPNCQRMVQFSPFRTRGLCMKWNKWQKSESLELIPYPTKDMLLSTLINLQTHKIRRTDWKKSAPFPDRSSMALIPTIASTNPDFFFFFFLCKKPSTSATNSSSRLRNWVTRTIFMSTAKIAHRNKWSSSKWCWRRRLRRQLQ